MKNILIIVIIIFIGSCKESNQESLEIQQWKLEWRMIKSSMGNNLELGEQQFDSLLLLEKPIDSKFLLGGLEILQKRGKEEKLLDILGRQDKSVIEKLCKEDLFTNELKNVKLCPSTKPEVIENVKLQDEIIRLYVDDQAIRRNVMKDIIKKYNIKESDITCNDDKYNRDKLKEIISEFGFPTRKLVGKDAMRGVFLIIQHSNGDKEWQKLQLKNIEKAIKNGDMESSDYAYLYDRIKTGSGKKQLYGTQFSNVIPDKGITELFPVEDIDNLDARRRKMGLMPIQIYKELTLSLLKNHSVK